MYVLAMYKLYHLSETLCTYKKMITNPKGHSLKKNTSVDLLVHTSGKCTYARFFALKVYTKVYTFLRDLRSTFRDNYTYRFRSKVQYL